MKDQITTEHENHCKPLKGSLEKNNKPGTAIRGAVLTVFEFVQNEGPQWSFISNKGPLWVFNPHG
eukprot:scaffold77952_cov48-Cyclotella_meneghiniana.AAC.1